jgi:serine/threonine protein kinase
MQTRENDDQLSLDWQGRQLGNYRLVRSIGRGGFAEVYLGEHVHLQNQVAIKLLQARLTRQDQESFLTEAQTIARLHHPHIVPVLEFGIEEGTPYLVMDYAPGGTLRQRYHPGTMLTPLRILPYLQQVASALAFAHEQRVVHRDVKPENMLLDSNGELLLADFGIALGLQSSRSQSMENMAGTASYMAPELLQGRVMPASDQYSLAVVIYEWLSGAPPFRGTFVEIASQHLLTPPPPLRQPAVSPEVEQVILTALHKNPQQRYASIQKFATAFEQATLMSATEETISLGPRQLALLRTMSQEDAPQPVAETQQTTLPPSPIVERVTGQLPTLPAQEVAPSTTPVTPATQVFEQKSATNTPVSLSTKTVPASASALPSSTVAKRPGCYRLMAIALIVLALLLFGEFSVGSYLILFPIQPAPLLEQKNLNSTQSPPHVWNVTTLSDKQAQKLYNQATGQKPIYSSTMAANDAYQWTEGGLSSGNCSFSGGAYHIKSVKALPSIWECIADQSSLTDFVFQTQITITEGDSGGVFFRATSNKGNPNAVYFFSIDKEGVYSLLVAPNPWNLLLLHSSTKIATGLNHPNLLTVIAQGTSIYLYINRHYVGSVTDSTATRGYLGFFAASTHARTFNAPVTTEVTCHMAQVWKLTTKLTV